MHEQAVGRPDGLRRQKRLHLDRGLHGVAVQLLHLQLLQLRAHMTCQALDPCRRILHLDQGSHAIMNGGDDLFERVVALAQDVILHRANYVLARPAICVWRRRVASGLVQVVDHANGIRIDLQAILAHRDAEVQVHCRPDRCDADDAAESFWPMFPQGDKRTLHGVNSRAVEGQECNDDASDRRSEDEQHGHQRNNHKYGP
mmetsp:Transcript_84757/g.215846  ORF Transcript_84757/g.215846 Transcript_84757/m.215846 type:complete len:201 (+) Transcript_84757:315-917(+)